MKFRFFKFCKRDSSKSVENENLTTIPVYELFKYSSWLDKIFIFIAIICASLSGICVALMALFYGEMLDGLIKFDIDHKIDALWEIATIFSSKNLICAICTFIGDYFAITLINYAAYNQMFRVRKEFFRSALHLDISWYDFHRSGEFANQLNENLLKYEESLGEKFVMLIQMCTGINVSLSIGFMQGWELASVCMLAIPGMLLSFYLMFTVRGKYNHVEIEANRKAAEIAEEVLSSIRLVKAFGGQEKELKRYEKVLSEVRKVNIRKGLITAMAHSLYWVILYGSYSFAFWYGVNIILEQTNWFDTEVSFTPGKLCTVFFAIMYVCKNFALVFPFLNTINGGRYAATKIFQLIDEKPKINPYNCKGIIPTKNLGNITFKNVRFEYPTRPEVKVLCNFNLTVTKGQTVALVGSSGCGKSTCIQLIQRFYDPIAGEILLDGVNIKDLNISSVRSRIGSVGQEPVLFSTTIFENIKYGKKEATASEIIAASKAANAHNFIIKLPKGYATLVGEKGAQLSGGQKQRIAIARALVRNPDILLLDEATSAMDTASEVIVQNALDNARKGRTTIIVAHRLSTIRNADKIVIIDNGRIMEIGNHDDLMKLKGSYYKLMKAQLCNMDLEWPTERINVNSSRNLAKKNLIIDNIETDNDEKPLETTSTFLKIIKWSRPELLPICVSSISSVILGCTFPLIAIFFGDFLTVFSTLDTNFIKSETKKFSLVFLTIGIIMSIMTIIQMYFLEIVKEKFTERLRYYTFSSMLKQEVGWFDIKSHGTGHLCSKLTSDATLAQGASGEVIGIMIQSLGMLITIFIISLYIDWRLGLMATSYLPIFLVTVHFQKKFNTSKNSHESRNQEESTQLVLDALTNIRTVTSLGQENLFYEKYVELLDPFIKRLRRNIHFLSICFAFSSAIIFISLSVTMFYGTYLIINENLSFATVVKLTRITLSGSGIFTHFLSYIPNIQKSIGAISRLSEIIYRQPKIQNPENSLNQKWISNGSFEFKNVDFQYPTRLNISIFKNFSLNIKKGQSIGIVGPSGSGKSTCIHLLQRFYDVSKGSVKLDNNDVRKLSLENVRSQFGVVSQEPTLFNRTIFENIAYGDNSRKVQEQEIIEAAIKANIHNYISSLPLGYETSLGDKGAQLSGGQKQRVAIARALIRNPRILLLDEATSALDAESEKVVQDALDAAREGRTCISIAHRLSTIIDSDIILVLDSGVIAESGTHKELIAQKGIYYNLYRLQNGIKS